jgi:small subunit ribosomal protein S7
MKDGKKSVAEYIVYTALEEAAKELGMSPVEVLEKAVEKVKPEYEVRTRRVGGATYQVPVEVPERRQISLALRWIVEAARERNIGDGKKNKMEYKLKQELIDAINEKGGAIKRRDETHRMAEANKVFSHFRW